MCLGALGRSEEALAALGPARGVDEAVGLAGATIRCQNLHAGFLLDLGRLDDARSEARAAAAAAESFSSHDNLAFALETLAEAAVLQHDLAEARDAVERLRLGAQSPMSAGPYWAAALVADAVGDPASVAACLAPVCDQLRSDRIMFAARHPDRLPTLAAIALRAGARDLAEVATDASTELARRSPDPALEAAAAYASGLLDNDPARLHRALDLLAADKRPLPRARISEDLGRILLSAGSTAQAVTLFETAYAAFAGCGSHRETRRVRAQLRSLGIRKRQATVARPDRGLAEPDEV